MSITKLAKHEIIVKVKELAQELGRIPTVVEINRIDGLTPHLLRTHFGNFDGLMIAADIFSKPVVTLTDEEKLIKKYRSLCSHTEQIQGFFRHRLDLDAMFKRAGYPKVLKLAAIPDVHVKFRDVPAVECTLKLLNYWSPNALLFFGDFLDCEGLSHWPSSDLEPRRIVPEAKEGRLLLERFNRATPSCLSRIFLEGNHEHWIDMALGKMPELFHGLEELGLEVNLKKLLDLDRLGYELYPMNHLVQVGNAHFTHGIYTATHHAKKHLDTFKCNIYYGHLHDTQEANATSIYGPIEAASSGTLARLDAKFLKGKPNNWVHSVSLFEFFKDGSYNRYKILINNGRTAYNGFVFDGNTPWSP